MNIAVLQASFPFNNPRRNAARLLDLALKAQEQGASLCIAPELSISGVLPRDLLLNHHFAHDCRLAVHWLADELGAQGPAVLVGSPMLASSQNGQAELQPDFSGSCAPDVLLNCAVLIDQGQARIIAEQKSIQAIGGHDYARYFSAGCGGGSFVLGDLRFAVVLGGDVLEQAPRCGDEKAGPERMDFAVNAPAATKILGAHSGPGEGQPAAVEPVRPGVMLCLAAVPFFGRGGYLFTRVLAEAAGKADLPLIFANAASAVGGTIFGGGSSLFCRTGIIQIRSRFFAEDILWLKAEREKGLTPLPGMASETGRIAVRPLYDAAEPELKSKEETTFSALQWGLKRFFEDNGFSRVFLGLSGGLDSALCATIAATALGPEAVCGVLMPSPHTSRESMDWALLLAKNLGIATHTLPINPLMNAFDRALAEPFAGLEKGVAEENLQARIRGALLMALANKLGGMVICPGNKSELAVGYSTLYGDSVGALALIGDIYKTEVYALAEWYNQRAGREVIPAGIIERPPTAELSPGQQDTDILPPYPLLDAILQQYIEEGRTAEEIRVKGADASLIAKVIKMVRCAEFKRRQAPPVVEIGVRPFGSEWRMPLGAE